MGLLSSNITKMKFLEQLKYVALGAVAVCFIANVSPSFDTNSVITLGLLIMFVCSEIQYKQTKK